MHSEAIKTEGKADNEEAKILIMNWTLEEIKYALSCDVNEWIILKRTMLQESYKTTIQGNKEIQPDSTH